MKSFMNNFAKKINYIAKNKKFCLCKNIIVIVIVIVAGFWSAACKEPAFVAMLEQLKPTEEIVKDTYTQDDWTTYNYEITGNQMRSLTEDPQIVFNDMKGFAGNITVKFAEKLQNDMLVQVFYSQNESGFSEDDSIKVNAYEGETEVVIPLMKQIDALRIDIGNESNQVIRLSEICNNNMDLKAATKKMFSSKIFWLRYVLLFLIYLFIGFHFIFNLNKMYGFIYKWRWVIAFAIIVFMTANQLHGDSIYMYDSYVQTGRGSEFVEPVLGEARAIRSDEWLVSTSHRLSSRFLENPYGRTSDIVRGTQSINPSHIGKTSIALNVLAIGTLLLGLEYGYCFSFNFTIVVGLLVAFEFFMILTKRKKLLSLLGSVMIICSSFFLWWGFPVILLYGHASLVAFYHFFHTNNRKIKLLCAFLTPQAVMNFITILYPAWEVPMGFVVLSLLIPIIHDNWNDIKKQRRNSWILFGIALCYCGIVLACYFREQAEYVASITSTVYPGSRISNGGYIWNKIWYYFQSFLYPFKDIGNPSEYSTLCSLFPLPIVLSVIYMIRNRKKDWMMCGLLTVSALLLFYTSVGIPGWLSKITMMQNSTPERAVDILGIICVYLIILLLSKEQSCCKKPVLNIMIGCIVVGISIYTCNKYFPEYMSYGYIIITGAVLILFSAVLIGGMNKRVRIISYVLMMILFVGSSIHIRPVQKGYDAIDSKPLAKEIRQINSEDPHQKWITCDGGLVLSAFSLACGAPTINSVNTYPNMDLWKRLDPEGQFDYVYNRYAHVAVEFTEEATSFTLVQPDTMRLSLSYQDISKTDAKYIVSNHPLEVENEYVSFQKIYGEYGSYIYYISYRDYQ